MKYDSIIETIKDGEIVIPLYMYKLLPSLKITVDSFIFLMYLRGKGNMTSFDVPRITKELGISDKTIMGYITELTSSNLIDIKVIKSDKGIMEEYISLDGFYEKMGLNIVSETTKEINESKDNMDDIFSLLEKEIGKQLSPIEIEIVKAWKESGYSEELIKAAIKEAVANDALSLRYIDKVLYNWDKDGVTTIEDVDKRKKKYRESKQEKPQIIEYNWLDENNE